MQSLTRKVVFIVAVTLLLSFVLGNAATASADPLGVTYTVTGGPGNWTLDFSVTNNIAGAPNQVFYFFGVALAGSTVTGSPALIPADPGIPVFNPSILFGGSNTNYNDIWLGSVDPSDAHPGTTTTGFDVLITSLTAPTSVQWFGFTEDTNFAPTYTAGGNFNVTGSQSFNAPVNPGFEGLATPSANPAVTEPASVWLLCSGLLALVGLKKSFA